MFKTTVNSLTPFSQRSDDNGVIGREGSSPATRTFQPTIPNPVATSILLQKNGAGEGASPPLVSIQNKRAQTSCIIDSSIGGTVLRSYDHNQEYHNLCNETDKESLSRLQHRSLDPLALQLRSCVERFSETYSRFLAKHKQFIKPEEEVQCAIRHAKLEGDIWDSAKRFEKDIDYILEIKSPKETLSKNKWHIKLGCFVIALFPVARVSLLFTRAVTEVLAFF